MKRLATALLLASAGVLLAPIAPVGSAGMAAQQDERLERIGYGSLTQHDLAVRVRNDDLEVRLVPLDERVTRLLARDAYESLRGLVASKRREIDSVAARAGLADPGLALVSFFAQRPGARVDAQAVTLLVRSRLFQPLGIVPLSPRFNSQQLEVRTQASAVYLFEEDLPVNDSFTMSYNGLTSEDWDSKQPMLERERARVAARARVEPPQRLPADSGR